MSGQLLTVDEASESIRRGEVLVVAGDARLLDRLPTGNWIGGSAPYLVTDQEAGRDRVHVTHLPGELAGVAVQVYDATTVHDVYADLSGKGFGIVIIPASSPTHLEFALHAPQYPGFAVRPLVGWISGAPLDAPQGPRPTVYCGTTGEVIEDGAVVMQVTLPPGRVADVGVVNIFEQGQGEAITFPCDGFDVGTAFVDGRETNFAEFVASKGLDTRLPLVADYYGVMVNVSFQAVDRAGRVVRFYSPVFAGLTYRHARPVGNYSQAFVSHLPASHPPGPAFACTCILNHFYADADTGPARGIPALLTFGEVAYQLLNQTTVYLTISDATRSS